MFANVVLHPPSLIALSLKYITCDRVWRHLARCCSLYYLFSGVCVPLPFTIQIRSELGMIRTCPSPSFLMSLLLSLPPLSLSAIFFLHPSNSFIKHLHARKKESGSEIQTQTVPD